MLSNNKYFNSIALILSVPFTSIGAVMLLWIAPGIVGKVVLVACQLWLLILPIIWVLKVENKPMKISLPERFDWITGIVIGLFMFLTILMMYWLFLRYWIDVNFVREKLAQVGKINRQEFIFGGAYFILINALIEEYFWRWFVYSRWTQLVDGKLAVLLSALSFTLHHAIGVAAFTDWRVVTAASLAVFIAGMMWSEYYRRYRSIWGNYFSHAIADLALHIIAWQVFFR